MLQCRIVCDIIGRKIYRAQVSCGVCKALYQYRIPNIRFRTYIPTLSIHLQPVQTATLQNFTRTSAFGITSCVSLLRNYCNADSALLSQWVKPRRPAETRSANHGGRPIKIQKTSCHTAKHTHKHKKRPCTALYVLFRVCSHAPRFM